MEEKNNNQDIPSKVKVSSRGGKRKGAGRPVGSGHKPKITDYMTIEEIQEVVDLYKSRAKTSERVLIHMVENLMGKPRQNLGLDGGDEGLKPILVKFINEKPTDNNNT